MAHGDQPLENERWVNERLALLTDSADWQPDADRAFARLGLVAAARRRRQRVWSLAAAVAVGGSLGAFALPTTQAFAERCVAACVAQTSRLGGLLWRPEAGPSSGLVPSASRLPAPDLILTDREGRDFSLSSYRGRVVLLNFWATWCLPCTREIPWFIEFKKTYAAQGLEVVGVSLDEDGWAAVGPYLDERGINYPIVLAVDRLEHQYPDVTALPTTLIVDRAGRVAARHVGLVERSAYEAEIEAALRLR